MHVCDYICACANADAGLGLKCESSSVNFLLIHQGVVLPLNLNLTDVAGLSGWLALVGVEVGSLFAVFPILELQTGFHAHLTPTWVLRI